MLNKKDIINFLFVISFSLYGIGNYVSAALRPSVGFLVSVSAYIVIILFYLFDILYRRELVRRVNGIFYIMLIFVIYAYTSNLISHYKGFPESTLIITYAKSLLYLIPFPAFIIFYLYNDKDLDNVPKLLFRGLGLLLATNMIGYFVLGLSNAGHNLEEQLNLPFFDGIYGAANLLVIISLVLIYRIFSSWADPVRLSWALPYLLLNLALLYFVNSRLMTMVFLFILGLMLFKSISSKLIYWLSWLILPVILNMTLVLYEILSLPMFAFIMKRIDFDDVTSFHGRGPVWQRGIDWLLEDQRGLLFGNGFKGEYFLGILYDLGFLWNPQNPNAIHFHSTTLQMLMDLGLFGFFIFAFLLYRIFMHYRDQFKENSAEGILFIMAVFMVINSQVSGFLVAGLGYLPFNFLVARVSLTARANEKVNSISKARERELIPS